MLSPAQRSIAASIHGLGVYLPDTIRGNDWWPLETVERWRETLSTAMPRSLTSVERETEGARASLRAMLALADDPFQGSRERRAMPDGMAASDMEVLAARRAMDDAGVEPREIDFLLTYSMVPDVLGVNPAALLHHRLGLAERCLALQVDASYGSFLGQLALAASLIGTGGAARGLLVQSSCGTRIAPPAAPHSAWLGDGASAAVVGAARHGQGLRAIRHGVDGTLHRAFVWGIPGRRWYEEGRIFAYSEEPAVAHRLMLGIADRATEALRQALEEASARPEEVGFYACHQPSSWLRPVTQSLAGLETARCVDLFERFGTIGACNLPVQLFEARSDGRLRGGDLVALFTVGAGATWSAALLEWE